MIYKFPIKAPFKLCYRKKRGGMPENETALGHVGRSFLLAGFFFASFLFIMFTLSYSGPVLMRSGQEKRNEEVKRFFAEEN